MKDKLNRPISAGDTVMFISYGTDWQFGMIAQVKETSIYIFVGWVDYNWTGSPTKRQYYTQKKRSNNHLLVLINDQVREAHTRHPFVSDGQTFEEFMEVYKEYCKTL